MNWLTGSKQGEAKRLVNHLGDVTKRDRAAQELIRLGSDAVPALLEALQTKDANLLPYYQQILARIPSATALLAKTLKTAHPVVRGRVAEIFGINKDPSVVPALLEALQGEYFTVRSRAALALGKMVEPRAIQPILYALKDPEDEVGIAAEYGAPQREGKAHIAWNSVFIVGLYLLPARYGDHELTNYLHARFCQTDSTSELCRIVIFNDDEFSHWIFFTGFVMINAAILFMQYIFSLPWGAQGYRFCFPWNQRSISGCRDRSQSWF